MEINKILKSKYNSDKADLTQTMIIISGFAVASVVAIGSVTTTVMDRGELAAQCIANYNVTNPAKGYFTIATNSEITVKGNVLTVRTPTSNDVDDDSFCNREEVIEEKFDIIQMTTSPSLKNTENRVHYYNTVNVRVSDKSKHQKVLTLNMSNPYDFSRYDFLGYKIGVDTGDSMRNAQNREFYGLIEKPDGSMKVEEITGDDAEFLRFKLRSHYDTEESFQSTDESGKINDFGVPIPDRIVPYNVIDLNWGRSHFNTAEQELYGYKIESVQTK